MKDDEFRILEEDMSSGEANIEEMLFNMLGKKVNPIQCIIEDRQDYFSRMKTVHRLYYKDDSAKLFNDDRVKSLYQMGELSLTDAIDLQYFVELDDRDKVYWLQYCNDNMSNLVVNLCSINSVINMTMSEINTNFILAKSLLDKARCVRVQDDKLSTKQRMRAERELKGNYIDKAQEVLNSLDEVLKDFYSKDQEISLSEIVDMKKELSKELYTVANRVGHYNIIMSGDDDMMVCKTVGFLRNGVAKDCWTSAKQNENKMKKLKRDYARTILSEEYEMQR